MFSRHESGMAWMSAGGDRIGTLGVGEGRYCILAASSAGFPGFSLGSCGRTFLPGAAVEFSPFSWPRPL